MSAFFRNLMVWTLACTIVAIPALASAATQEDDPGLLIRKIMGLAYESNQTLNSVPYSIGDSLTDVENDWGPADDKGTVAANYYDHHVRFLYDNSTPEQTITAIDEFDPQLTIIKLQDVKQLLGQPMSEKEQEGNYYVTYSANQDHKVIFVFESAFTNPNPTLQMYLLQPK